MFTKIIIPLSVLALAFVSCEQQSKIEKEEIKLNQQPNIIIIMADDLGYNDVGFNGSTDIPTPQLDVLANQGTKFTSAYVPHSFCGPSRMGMLAGRYAHEFGGQFNLPPDSEGSHDGISVDEKLMSKALKESGYQTGIVGKWHLGEDPEYHPNVRGFDDFYGFLGGGHEYFPEHYKAKYAKGDRWNYLLPMEHNGKEVTDDDEYITDELSNQGIRFIENASKKENPFFLFMSYNAPHTPLRAKDEDLAMAQIAKIQDKDRRTYAAMVYALDRGVGRLVDALKANGEYENTLIVFLSDNGGRPDKGASNLPLQGRKGSVYEGGYRVPMFFHWPNQVRSGVTYDYSITSLDFYPTFLGLANASIPSGKKLDGLDVWNFIKEGKNPRQDKMIYTMRLEPQFINVGGRKNDWKICLSEKRGKWELFNLTNDISEQNDISAQHPDVLKEMVEEMHGWSKTHKDPKWFHNQATDDEWHANNMPNYEKTFSLIQ